MVFAGARASRGGHGGIASSPQCDAGDHRHPVRGSGSDSFHWPPQSARRLVSLRWRPAARRCRALSGYRRGQSAACAMAVRGDRRGGAGSRRGSGGRVQRDHSPRNRRFAVFVRASARGGDGCCRDDTASPAGFSRRFDPVPSGRGFRSTRPYRGLARNAVGSAAMEPPGRTRRLLGPGDCHRIAGCHRAVAEASLHRRCARRRGDHVIRGARCENDVPGGDACDRCLRRLLHDGGPHALVVRIAVDRGAVRLAGFHPDLRGSRRRRAGTTHSSAGAGLPSRRQAPGC